MSSLLRNTAAALRHGVSVHARAQQLLLRRAIASSLQSRHKESASHNHEHHDVTKHKEDLLAKHKAGKGHWKPELASDSEEAVKADRAARQGAESTTDHVKELQERTKAAAEETSKAGTSMRDGL